MHKATHAGKPDFGVDGAPDKPAVMVEGNMRPLAQKPPDSGAYPIE
ncbi:MAG: hypothetical protein GDA35_00570 [Hyphomonadaceae bacterium]|nr:hypothetical protein [Hyphomonadaceae bacterium]